MLNCCLVTITNTIGGSSERISTFSWPERTYTLLACASPTHPLSASGGHVVLLPARRRCRGPPQPGIPSTSAAGTGVSEPSNDVDSTAARASSAAAAFGRWVAALSGTGRGGGFVGYFVPAQRHSALPRGWVAGSTMWKDKDDAPLSTDAADGIINNPTAHFNLVLPQPVRGAGPRRAPRRGGASPIYCPPSNFRASPTRLALAIKSACAAAGIAWSILHT